MQLTLIYDMRAPAFGAPRTELFRTALDQAEWADAAGFDVIGLGEHHSAEDGYNPSSLVLAAAMAARTRRIMLRTSVLLAPLYDPVKLAEDAAITQTIANGRLLLGIGAGYRPVEFETFGRNLGDRWRVMGETCAFLKQAWTGEPFEWQGRRVIVRPRPEPFPPPILLGGESPKAARRAAHIADGWFPPVDARLWPPYREECLALGKPDPGPYPNQGPVFLWVDEDPEAAWERLMPHVLHQMQSYAQWTIEAYGHTSGPYAGGVTAETVRESGIYQILSPEQTLALAEKLGPHSVLYLSPLLAGIAPEESWRMLRLFETRVLPHLPGRGGTV
jgi:alkanesulfonate monooxygenase SsuD/methylene tetrahydromethanopterin reductase-like flavin-dependent oxidoreductase (luciferase family)